MIEVDPNACPDCGLDLDCDEDVCYCPACYWMEDDDDDDE